MSNQVNDENVGLLKQLVTTVQKKNDKEKVDNSIKMKPAKVIGVDEDTYKVFVYFIDDIEQNAYTFYNKSGEVLSEGDNVKVYYTTNPAKGWIGARCGETNIKEITVYGGEGVGRPSPWDKTSEYFNDYKNNIAGNSKSSSAHYAHAEGHGTSATGANSHAEGLYTTASGESSHAEGYNTSATGAKSHAEGSLTTASGNYSHAEGEDTQATALYAHAEGYLTVASAEGSHAEGLSAKALQVAAHSEGQSTEASGSCSHAEGQLTKATSFESHAEGYYTQATNFASHAEGNYTVASGNSSHAEGSSTQATGTFSHAEGGSCIASGSQSHAGGYSSEANGYCSFAHGYGVIVNDMYPEGYPVVAFGQYNNYSSNDKYLFVIGNGTADDKRSNAFAVDKDGNIYCNSVNAQSGGNITFEPYTTDEAITAATTTFNNIME